MLGIYAASQQHYSAVDMHTHKEVLVNYVDRTVSHEEPHFGISYSGTLFQHPYIASPTDEYSNEAYYVRIEPFYNVESLSQLIMMNGPQHYNDVIKWAVAVCEAMIYLNDDKGYIYVPDWFAMRHGRTQAIFCSHYETEEKLFSRIYEATILQKYLKDSCDPELVIEDGVLTEYEGNAEYVVVPDGVTAIGDCVFWQNKSLREIRLPEGVAHISDAAFCTCENLETINFPKSLLYIGKDAFFACEKSSQIELSNNLTTISENAFGSCINIRNLHIPKRLRQLSSDSFQGCTKLETITLDDESEAFDLYDGCLYDILMKKLYIVPGTKKNVIFPNGIKEIGQAFSGTILLRPYCFRIA